MPGTPIGQPNPASAPVPPPRLAQSAVPRRTHLEQGNDLGVILAHLADDPLHHYELAVNIARQRSRRVELARTLIQVGHYLEDRAEVKLQAQGRAYLREAQVLTEEIGLPSTPSGA